MRPLGKTYLIEIPDQKEEVLAGGILLPAENKNKLVHYRGTICGYDGKIACENCPFKQEGVATLPLHEDSSLDYGQSTPNNYCCHNNAFFAQPNYQDILNQQMWEMQNR